MAFRVLIVDDDLYIRELYEEVLKNAQYEVETAADGKEGLSKLKAGGYDLVLLDVMLPYVDGIGILTELEENKPAKKNGPIILLTNLASDPAVKEALSHGAKAALSKADMNPDEFLKKIKEFGGKTE